MVRPKCTTIVWATLTDKRHRHHCVKPSDINYEKGGLENGVCVRLVCRMSITGVSSEYHRNRSLGYTRRLKGWF